MHVGNDVVDLRDPEARSSGLHSRFDQRVFSSCERARLQAAAAAERLRWSLWAAKESAFKAARKLDGSVPFHPRRFVVQGVDGRRTEVVHELVGRFRIWLDHARDWVHAVATPAATGEEEEDRPPSALAVLDDASTSAAELSRRVRELVTDAVAPLVTADPSFLRVETVGGIPEIRLGRRRLPLDVSLSHHGRVVACSWLFRPEGAYPDVSG